MVSNVITGNMPNIHLTSSVARRVRPVQQTAIIQNDDHRIAAATVSTALVSPGTPGVLAERQGSLERI